MKVRIEAKKEVETFAEAIEICDELNEKGFDFVPRMIHEVPSKENPMKMETQETALTRDEMVKLDEQQKEASKANEEKPEEEKPEEEK